MQKELLQVEFRYHKIPLGEYLSDWERKLITIGIYDTLIDAVSEGNKTLKKLSKEFKFTEKFGINNGVFGTPTRLVTDFSARHIQVFVSITKLHFDNVLDVMNIALETDKKYRNWKESYNRE